MAMGSMYYKEQDGAMGSNQMGSVSPAGSGPWWSGLVARTTFDEPVRQVMETHSPCAPIAPNPSDHGANQVFEKGDPTEFSIFPGLTFYDIDGSNDHKPVQAQSTFSKLSAPTMDHHGQVDLGFGQPGAVIYGRYPYYGLFSTYGSQIAGRIMLPFNLSTDDGPIFVNAKQYHGIIRRRHCRAKAKMMNKAQRSRKPYMHRSRHLHAMRRPRGCGGRFLNTRKADHSNGLENGSSGYVVQTTDGGPHVSGSEVTSVFSISDLNRFPIEGVSFSDMMIYENRVPGFDMSGSWVAATRGGGCENRCDLAM